MIGAPYKHLGRNRRGIDCLGLVFYAADIKEEGEEESVTAKELLGGYYSGTRWVYDKTDPKVIESCRILRAALTKRLLECSIDQLQEGDILLISYKSGDDELGDHVGVYAGDGKMIHADVRRGVVEIKIPERVWRRVIAVFRKVN